MRAIELLGAMGASEAESRLFALMEHEYTPERLTRMAANDNHRGLEYQMLYKLVIALKLLKSPHVDAAAERIKGIFRSSWIGKALSELSPEKWKRVAPE